VRICSLSPFATEVLLSLGAGSSLVGVSWDCLHMPEVAGLPVVARWRLGPESLGEFDEAHEQRAPLYSLDEEALLACSPTLIITQDICPICHPSSDAVFRNLRAKGLAPKVFPLEIRSLREGLEGTLQIGRLVGKLGEAQALVRRLRARSEELLSRTLGLSVRPKVLSLEWPEPPHVSGFWVPEAIYLAGGTDGLGLPGRPHFKLKEGEAEAYAPDVILLASRFLDLETLLHVAQGPLLRALRTKLPSVKLYALEARRLLASPGAGLYEALPLLAKLLHPALFGELSEQERLQAIEVPAQG